MHRRIVAAVNAALAGTAWAVLILDWLPWPAITVAGPASAQLACVGAAATVVAAVAWVHCPIDHVYRAGYEAGRRDGIRERNRPAGALRRTQ